MNLKLANGMSVEIVSVVFFVYLNTSAMLAFSNTIVNIRNFYGTELCNGWIRKDFDKLFSTEY